MKWMKKGFCSGRYSRCLSSALRSVLKRGTVICEQIKAIDPKARGCSRVDLLSYENIMNVYDAVQGIIEYD